MIKDYIVIDNALESPDEVRDELLKMEFYSNEEFTLEGMRVGNDKEKPTGNWRGFRTKDLVNYFPAHAKRLAEPLLTRAFGFNLSLGSNSVALFGHIATSRMDSYVNYKTRWHIDVCESFAGVIYLNKEAPKDTGTFLKLKNKTLKIPNVYNRFVLYKSNIRHRPGAFFGSDINNSRLTLTVFLHKLVILPPEEKPLY